LDHAPQRASAAVIDEGQVSSALWVAKICSVENEKKRVALEKVTAELLAREPIFHKPEFGTTHEDYAAQTDEDYWEVGASGRIYDREGILKGLVERGKVPGDEDWVISEVRCRDVGAHTYAFTYQLDQAGRLTRRLTIWRRDGGSWKAVYHQGTLVQNS
jgi:hypothetical protein